MFSYTHPNYCEKCRRNACLVRTDLPTCKMVLRPGYSAARLNVQRRRDQSSIAAFDLKITEVAEYKARPLPHGGLDLIRNHYNDSMLSDRADFHFHEHDFEVCDTVPFGHEGEKQGVTFCIPKGTETFIGDVVGLTMRRRPTEPKPLFRVKPDVYFHRIYRNRKFIGYGFNEALYAYNAIDEKMYRNEGVYDMRIIKYTDKATRKADGILFGGLQNENWMNYLEGAESEMTDCEGCLRVSQGCGIKLGKN